MEFSDGRIVDEHGQANLDPDYFDIVVQSLSVLSSIATLGASWLAINQSQQKRDAENLLLRIEDSARHLERDFDDTFHNAQRVLSLLRQSYEQREGKSVDDQKPRFGSVAVQLTPSQLRELMQPLTNMSNAASQVRTQATVLQNNLAHHKPVGEDRIDFDLARFNDDLNDILFNSATLGDATAKLRGVQVRAEDFIRSVCRSLQGN